MSFNIKTPQEVLMQIAARMKQKRLDLNLTQGGLATRTGISIGTIKHFEKTGKTSFDTVLQMALALGCLDDFDALLLPSYKPQNLFGTDNTNTRKRGRIK